MRPRTDLLAFLLIILLIVSIRSFATDPVSLNDTVKVVEVDDEYTDIFIDSTNQLSLNEIIELDRFNPNIKGYNTPVTSTFWIRFKVKTDLSHQPKWVLEVLDSRHNDMSLFVPKGSNSQQYIEHKAGLNHGFSNRAYQHKNIVMDIHFGKSSEAYYYLKVKSDVVCSMLFKLRSNQEFSSYAFKEYYLLGMYYGILGIILIYNLFLYISIKEKIYLYYVFYVVMWAFHSLIDDGIGYQYIWTDLRWVSEIGFFVSRPLLLVFLILYSRQFLESSKQFPTYDKLIVFGTVTYLVYSFINHFVQVDIIANILFLLPMFLVYYVSIKAYKKGYQPARFFIIGNTFVLIGILIRIFADFGIIATLTDSVTVKIYAIYSRNIGFIIEIMILSYALGDRFRFLKSREQEAQQKVIEHLKENEELSQKVNRELEVKVSERTQALNQKSLELEEANEKLNKQAEEINSMNLALDLHNRKLQKNINEATKARIQLKEVNYEELLNIYPDDNSVVKYIAEIKWRDGYSCKKCKNKKYCDGLKKHSRRCTKCRYDESATTNTVFHKCKFDLTKAFYIALKVKHRGESLVANEVAKEINIRPATVWRFKQKIVEAISKRGKRKEEDISDLILDQ